MVSRTIPRQLKQVKKRKKSARIFLLSFSVKCFFLLCSVCSSVLADTSHPEGDEVSTYCNTSIYLNTVLVVSKKTSDVVLLFRGQLYEINCSANQKQEICIHKFKIENEFFLLVVYSTWQINRSLFWFICYYVSTKTSYQTLWCFLNFTIWVSPNMVVPEMFFLSKFSF